MRDHTSLVAWQRARIVSLAVISLSRQYWSPPAAALFSQLQRSSLSAQLNIAEGFALAGPALFRRHLRIAYGSAVETTDLLLLMKDTGLIAEKVLSAPIATSRETCRLILGLLRSLETAGPLGR